MLEYENQMFLEILHEDGLVITAKGLSLETVFANIIRAYLDPGNLVIVLGTISHDEQYFIDLLKSYGLKHLPRIITSECSSAEREILYLEGGVLFMSGPILVVDLLKKRVPLNLVTGILVYRAHNILNAYQQSFALRLYRQNNKAGFIKAFTNSALAFTVGFMQVERVMKALFVKKLYLWPRFHSLVNNTLEKHKPDVIELHVKITPKMLNIQTSLLDIMNFVIKELKRLNIDTLFKNAKERVYNDKNELKPEANPKWTALTEVLLEIDNDNKKKADRNVEKIFILVHNRNICYQLRNCLTMGCSEYLLYEAMKKLSHKEVQKLSDNNIEKESSSVKKDDDDDDVNAEQDSYVLTLSQKVREESQSSSSVNEDKHQTFFEDCSQMAELDLTNMNTNSPVILIQSLKKDGDPMALQRALNEHMPNNIIMYVADISAVRQIEIYQNNNPSIDLKVYFLIYGGSVEEQEYLTSLRREKEAFHTLINAKTTMVIPDDQDGKTEDCLSLQVQSDTDSEANTRKGGLRVQLDVSDTVIVDMREFRSELPAILYTRGMKIEPITLQVGDYILSPDICVERKSISDLIGSLNSGRLYNQAIAMTRHYSKPMLLIEFDPNKPFCFQGHYYASKDIQNMFITSKLQLLTLHFPRLKLVWSPGPHATAQLFEELKQGKDQPDATTAAQIGFEENKEMTVEKYNPHIQDLVAKLPGVTTKNLHMILNKGQSLDHLNKLTKEELTEMLGNKNDAQMFYSAFHDKCAISEQKSNTSSKKPASKGRGKRLFTKIKK
ncbi:PREDICTED: DNA repair endonuclease XPF [Habropoda laboriosa]|uniref:DNA repair endonuclease XPF n=1 Tax=Habropoda laboriosa TaxID=597456 RepID=UPI00083E63C3|nr:PREDICTED: DNA repair endonuclease XPF [Habropoda laboriosa]